MYKCIIFDLDGTLLNTIDDICDSINASLRRLNKNINSDHCKSFVGSGVDKLISRTLDFLGINSIENFEYLKKTYLEEYKKRQFYKTSLYPNTFETLKKLKDCNIKIAVLSNKPDDDTQRIISHYFKDFKFDCVFGKKNEFDIKPSPDALNEIIRILGVNKEEVLYCGDSDVDMQTAINADVVSIGATWGFRSYEELNMYSPKYIISNIDEIAKIIEVK